MTAVPTIGAHEIFKVDQHSRVDHMLKNIEPWFKLNRRPNDLLIISIPQTYAGWENSFSASISPTGLQELLEWIEQNRKNISGPVYNLPALTASYMLLAVDQDFDLAYAELESSPPEEVGHVLASVRAKLLEQYAAA